MLYTVEISLSTARFGFEMAQMRAWLDHMRYQPAGFTVARGLRTCRVDFESEGEAHRFSTPVHTTRFMNDGDPSHAHVCSGNPYPG